MRIAYINPNATDAMTERVTEVVRTLSGTDEVIGYTNVGGPLAIQGPEDGQAAIKGVLALVDTAIAEGADAIVIACFDDTGLDAARAKSSVPVLGIGQAAFTMATLLGKRFSVVTSLAVSIPVIEKNIVHQNFAASCQSVQASHLPVLTIDEGSAETRNTLATAIRTTMATDGVDTIVLGCAGMAHLLDDLKNRTQGLLLDGVRASYALARACAVYPNSNR